MLYLRTVLSLMTLLFITTQVVAQTAEKTMASSNPLVGAWLITETAITDAEGITRVDTDPATGVYIFTEEHFSAMLVPREAREPVYLVDHTDAELLEAYSNFSADAGSYTYDDSSMVTTNMIAKIPDFMTSSMHYQWWIEEDGQELILDFADGWAPAGGKIVYRLQRME